MAKPIIRVDRGTRPVGEARLPAHHAHCPDCTYVAKHKHSAMAVGKVAVHGEEVHGWTERPTVKEK